MPALGQFLGSSAGLSSSVITKLTETWKAEAAAFAQRDLAGTDYVYVWADGIHLNIRLDEEKLCLLVMIGVRIDGRKELIALAPGYRESSESWSDLMRDCVRRGMRAPVLAAATARSDSGVRCAMCSLRRKNSAAGSTKSQTFSVRCRSRRTPARRKRETGLGGLFMPVTVSEVSDISGL